MSDQDGKPGRHKAEQAVRTLLRYLGEDTSREGLRNTPQRYVRALDEITSEPDYTPTTFESQQYEGMVVQSGISVYSMCEHHMLPIVGHATVAYIPNGKIVGLSKLARCVERHSRRLQNQERITLGVVDELEQALHPVAIGCILTARHMCMEMRGVNERGTTTTTTSMRGTFSEDGEARQQFMQLVDQDNNFQS